MNQIEARKIRLEEAETYRRIGGYAYANWLDELDEWNPEPALRNNMLATFADGTMTARLVNHSYEQVVRGVWRAASAIGGVATLPEYRRQGHVRKLLDATFADMREKGLAVAALYPFNESFYAKFGYVRTNAIPQLHLECSALNHLLPLVNPVDQGWHYERLPTVKSGKALQEFTHAVATQSNRPEYNGFMRDPARSTDDWANEQIVFVKEGTAGKIVAAARYVLKGYGNGTVRVHECHWIGASARDRLLAFFALHGGEMEKIRLSVAPGVNFHSWLSDSTKSYEAKLSHLPIMVRVMDVAQVLTGIQVGANESADRCIFAVTDERCPWVGGTFALTENDGVLAAKRRDGEATVTMTIEGVTAMAYGTLPVDEIVYRGWITGADAKQTALLSRWFPVQSVFNLLGF